MTISSALNSAMSGLRAATRASELVSSNIANVMTPGYARRTLSLSSAVTGAASGVRIDGVQRHMDAQVVGDLRVASSEFSYRTNTSAFLSRLERLFGAADQPDSLSGRLAEFEKNLITASSRPDATERLDILAMTARDLSVSINTVSDGIQASRIQAESSITQQVTRLNNALRGVQKLNISITATAAKQSQTAAFLDQRRALIDEINEIVPVRVVERDHGAVALFSTGGAILLDGRAANIGFETKKTITAHMSLENGMLSGLTIDGFPAGASSGSGRMNGGRLGAEFEIRDTLAPSAQVQMDALARDLIERFESTDVDPTFVSGNPGLFTDSGSGFDPMAEVGLASRLALNPIVDPTKDGESWRLRDGLSANAPGSAGDATLLNAWADALTVPRSQPSSSLGPSALSAAGVFASITSQVVSDRMREDQLLSFTSAQFHELTNLELSNGVDTDVELQNLMVIEQAYAANARVIEAVDQMFNTLLRI